MAIYKKTPKRKFLLFFHAAMSFRKLLLQDGVQPTTSSNRYKLLFRPIPGCYTITGRLSDAPEMSTKIGGEAVRLAKRRYNSTTQEGILTRKARCLPRRKPGNNPLTGVPFFFFALPGFHPLIGFRAGSPHSRGAIPLFDCSTMNLLTFRHE